MRTPFIFGGLLAAVLICASSAHAQAPSSPLPVKLGQHVWVTATDGSEITGVVSDITAAAIEVKNENSTKRFNVTDVRRIAKRDSMKNGAIIGGSAWAALGVLAATCCEPLKLKSTGTKVGVVALDFAAGAGIGALVDYALKGRHTVYERPTSSTSLQLTPIVAPRRVGVGGTIRW
jgi:hypothetical protein